MLLAIGGSLVEATMKDPYKLAHDAWSTYRSQVPDQLGKSFAMFWYRVSNFKLYYFFVGLLFLIFATTISLLLLGVVAGTFIGGAFYAQP